MFQQDFPLILNWWLTLFGLGVTFLPLTFRIFSSFWDKGYSFAKVLAILVAAYSVWFLGSLRLAPFSRTTVLAVIGFWALVNWRPWEVKNQESKVKSVIGSSWRVFLFEEALFALCLLVWAWVRAVQPDIHGLEKFMDFGFVNSILRSPYFPPADMWFSGETINYYYFGHFVAAFLTKLSSLDSAFTYNLMIAAIFAFAFTLTFSLASNLVYQYQKSNIKYQKRGGFGFKVVVAGLISAFLLSLGGNLHPFWWYLTHHNFSSYWYPDATRFIGYNPPTEDKTIHEFPSYSFTVSDLHSHVSDIPFILLFLGLLLSFMLTMTGSKKKNYALCLTRYILLLSLALAVMYMTNSADALMYFAVLAVAAVLLHLRGAMESFVLALAFSLPFWSNFHQLVKGVAFVHSRSPWWQLAVLWGGPLLFFLLFLVFLLGKKRGGRTADFSLIDFLVAIFGLFALAFVAAPEIIFFKDIYIGSYYRANTMLKFSYQAFILFSLISGFLIVRLLSLAGGAFVKASLALAFLAFFLSATVYPYFSLVRGYYGPLGRYKRLYGLDFFKRSYPDDFGGSLWLKKNVAGQPVILEAVGESYTDFGRVSTVTGLPTVLGWPVHEWLWRGSYDEPGKRREAVRHLYELEDAEESRKLLDEYGVEYVFLGELEKKQYGNLKGEKFKKLGKLVYKSGRTEIYKVR